MHVCDTVFFSPSMRVKMGGVGVCIGNRQLRVLLRVLNPVVLSQESMCVRGWVVASEGFSRGSVLSRWQLLGGLLHVVNIALLEHKVIFFSIETKANHDQPI